VDNALINFPPVRAMAALLEVMNTRRKKLFRDFFVPGVSLIPDEPSEVIDVSLDVAPARLVLDFRRPTVGRYETDYHPADLRVLSRAVHKLAFESIAWYAYVIGNAEPVDLFASTFDRMRQWVRRGEPQQKPARPWLWQFPSQDCRQSWYVEPLHFIKSRGLVQMRVLGIWLLVDVTSENHSALSSLSEHEKAPNTVRVADSMELCNA